MSYPKPEDHLFSVVTHCLHNALVATFHPRRPPSVCRDERGPTALLNVVGVLQRFPFEQAHAKHCTQNRIPWLMCCKADPLSSLPAFWRYSLKCIRLCGRANRRERVYLLTSQQSEGTLLLPSRTVSDRCILQLHISTVLALICHWHNYLTFLCRPNVTLGLSSLKNNFFLCVSHRDLIHKYEHAVVGTTLIFLRAIFQYNSLRSPDNKDLLLSNLSCYEINISERSGTNNSVKSNTIFKKSFDYKIRSLVSKV
jgi:hypothetical protein